MDVIILAGGLGTRLRSVVSDVPKCMASVAGKPFLFYLLSYLSKFDNIQKVILSVGYLRDSISKWIDDNGSQFSFQFDYAIEQEPLGTGGAIRLALGKTASPDVLVLNGDTFFDVDLNSFFEFHLTTKALISMALKPMNDFDRYGTVGIDEKTGKICSFSEKKYSESGLINGGVYLLNRDRLQMNDLPEKFSFEKDILERCVNTESLAGYIQDNYFIDIGIPEDFNKANTDFGQLFSFKIPEIDYDKFETLFLDRDGVINLLRKNDYVKKWDEFKFTQGILDLLAKWSKCFKHIIIITNQRGVGKGIMSEGDLNEIHTKMLEQIQKFGGRVDKIYYCTVIDNQNINRKPNPGMAYQAQRDFPDIDFSKTLMIGDSESDFEFAKNINCKFVKA